MSTAIHVIPEPLPTTSETRYAAYLLAEYLERLGVEVVFGLTGHTVIGMLDALGRSRIRYVSTRHEQVAAHAADGYARATGKPGVLLTHLGPGLTNAATGVANAGSFTNGMPMTSSLGCGIWGGNITNENIHLKHFMQTTWVSRPIPEDRPSDQELFGEFYNTETM